MVDVSTDILPEGAFCSVKVSYYAKITCFSTVLMPAVNYIPGVRTFLFFKLLFFFFIFHAVVEIRQPLY